MTSQPRVFCRWYAFRMKLRYIFILLLILAVVFFGLRYINQRGSVLAEPSISFPPGGEQSTSSTAPIAGVPGCIRTTEPIETNILGIGQPAGFTMKDLSYLLDLGVKWVRTDFYWSDIETSEGAIRRWDAIDNTARVLNQNNIHLLLSVTYVPDWVGAKDKQGRWDATYAFAKELAARNRGKVRYYEIFKEPNLPGFGFFRVREGPFKAGDSVDVSTYLNFLAAANKGIHEADPSAVIVLGGLSGVSDSRTYMNARTFMKQLYELGGKDCFDVLAYNPYESFGTGGGFIEKAAAIRAFTALYGDSAKTIWFNELGTTDEGTRADSLQQVKNEISAVPAWFWFSLRDFNDTEEFGLLSADYQKRPAYELFKQMLAPR